MNSASTRSVTSPRYESDYDVAGHLGRSGGIGRRDGLKHRWGQPRTSSSLVSGTTDEPSDGTCRACYHRTREPGATARQDEGSESWSADDPPPIARHHARRRVDRVGGMVESRPRSAGHD